MQNLLSCPVIAHLALTVTALCIQYAHLTADHHRRMEEHMLDQPLTSSQPTVVPTYVQPPLMAKRPPRCPPMLEITSSDQLLPSLDAVAKRPYNQGLHACWDLKRGERVLLRVDNWHDPMVVE